MLEPSHLGLLYVHMQACTHTQTEIIRKFCKNHFSYLYALSEHLPLVAENGTASSRSNVDLQVFFPDKAAQYSGCRAIL